MGGEEAYKEEAEFNALSNLADSLPDGSSEEEDLAMETDPRHIISQSLKKTLLDPRAAEEEATVEEEGNVLEGNDSGGNDSLDVIPFCIPCEGNVCSCEDKRQMIFFPSGEEYYDCLDDSTRDQVGNLDDQRYWNSDDEDEDQ